MADVGSLGYASRLSFRAELGGTLGEPEVQEASSNVAAKARELARLIAGSQHFVAFTGAGISTSTGIPDFRGPNGVWTKQRRGEELPRASIPFEHARPSLTHQALLALQRAGRLKYLVSQNVDSLHLRSGFPREQIAELHGNCFAERCARCQREFVRDFEVGSVGFKPTGRKCVSCFGPLHDHCLDWDNALPEDELEQAERHSSKADLALCLGTSLVITPARDIPLRVLSKRKHKPAGGKLAIANLQATPLDRRAAIVVHAPVDELMARVMGHLNLPIPAYTRTDVMCVSHEAGGTLPRSESCPPRRTIRLLLRSAHGAGCPLPWLESCEARFAISTDEPSRTLRGPTWAVDLPLPRGGELARQLTVELTLHLAQGTNAPVATVEYEAVLAGAAKTKRGACARYEIVTAYQEYPHPMCAHERAPASLAQSNAAAADGKSVGAAMDAGVAAGASPGASPGAFAPSEPLPPPLPFRDSSAASNETTAETSACSAERPAPFAPVDDAATPKAAHTEAPAPKRARV